MEGGRVPRLRKAFQRDKLSETAQQLIFDSWRGATPGAYNTGWNRWERYARKHRFNPTNPSSARLANYVAKRYKKGLRGKSVAACLHPIATTLRLFNNHNVDDPRVRRVVRGALLNRPSKPRYREFWNPEKLLDHIRTMGENGTMPLPDLHDKCNALLRLALLARSSDLAAINLNGLEHTPDGLRFTFGPLKQTGPGQDLPVQVVPRYNEDLAICPVEACKALVERTTRWRKLDDAKPGRPYMDDWNGLFLALTGDHKKLSSERIASRFLALMAKAGIDTKRWKAHSARGATATWLLNKGATVDEVMRLGRWTSLLVFRDFYNRAIKDVNAIATLARQDALGPVFHETS